MGKKESKKSVPRFLDTPHLTAAVVSPSLAKGQILDCILRKWMVDGTLQIKQSTRLPLPAAAAAAAEVSLPLPAARLELDTEKRRKKASFHPVLQVAPHPPLPLYVILHSVPPPFPLSVLRKSAQNWGLCRRTILRSLLMHACSCSGGRLPAEYKREYCQAKLSSHSLLPQGTCIRIHAGFPKTCNGVIAHVRESILDLSIAIGRCCAVCYAVSKKKKKSLSRKPSDK